MRDPASEDTDYKKCFFTPPDFFFVLFAKYFFLQNPVYAPGVRDISYWIFMACILKKKITEKKSLAIVFYCLFSVYIVYTVSQPSVEFRGITLCIYHFISYILYFHIKYLKLAAKKYSFNKIYEQITSSYRSHQMAVTSQVSAVVYFRSNSEDDIYVQAVPGLILDRLDWARQLPPPEIEKFTKNHIHN